MPMNYSIISSDMTWSYSRLTRFEDCRYAWLLKYIYKEKGEALFFSSYGSFMHGVIQKYLCEELSKSSLPIYFASNYRDKVRGRPPNAELYGKYLRQGVEYLSGISLEPKSAIEVECYDEFQVGGIDFCGITDIVYKDGEKRQIIDNKSHALKPRTEKNSASGDRKLDSYLRQLYLYSIPFKGKYGRWPDELCFNCFRTGFFIRNPFDEQALHNTIAWAENLVNTIIDNEDWGPNIEPFKCRYICDVHNQCEYFQLMQKAGM